jgi:hypothetical protein
VSRPAGDRAAWLGGLAESLVRFSWTRAPLVLAAALALTLLFGWFAASRLGLDTAPERLLAEDLQWQAERRALNAAFPQRTDVLLVVVDGGTPAIALAAAEALAAAMRAEPSLFRTVSAPSLSPFLRRNALLFLAPDELRAVADRLVAAQGLIATLAADPTPNGLFAALNLALDGLERGEVAWTTLDRPLAAVAEAAAASLEGGRRFVDWTNLLTGRESGAKELRQIIAVQPALDHDSLTPGAAAQDRIARIAERLGHTPENGVALRFTGDIPLADEEFASVEAGIGVGTALSFAAVLVLLYLAMGRARPVAASLVVLAAGLVWTLAFAAASVGTLNLVSVAFVVMFVGIAVDFSIQFCVRLRDGAAGASSAGAAAARTGRIVGSALLLAAATNAIGFLAFAPTAYRGVSELGIIAGASMAIALLLNLTVLPALLRVFGAAPTPLGSPPARLIAADRLLARHRKAVLVASGAVGLAALALVPRVAFDFNPLNLKDPDAPSVRTLRAAMADGTITPHTMETVVPRTDLAATVAHLESLEEVGDVVSVASFVPRGQAEKRAIVEDAAQFLLPALPPPGAKRPDLAVTAAASMTETIGRLRGLARDRAAEAPRLGALAGLLERVREGGPTALAGLDANLMPGLALQIESVALMLDPQPAPITEADIPEDIARDWRAADGRYRIEALPAGDAGDTATVSRFIDAVRAAVPGAVGEAYFLREAGRTVWRAFQEAFAYALAGVCVVLYAALRRVRDVALVVGPLIFAALMTLGTATLAGIPINFANVIALPLLLGLGAAFNIYFVANWRAGRAEPLQSSMARAVLFSALTTLAAVASLSLSPHAGTASLGIVLALCLFYALVTALVVLPALLGPPRAER